MDAQQPGQRYKIGKYILETKRVVRAVSWEDEVESLQEDELAAHADQDDDGVVMFDDEDSDECDDLFAGIWDPAIVAKRRARRINSRTINAGD